VIYFAYGLTIDSVSTIAGLSRRPNNSPGARPDLFVDFGSPSPAVERALRSQAKELPASRNARYADDAKFSLSRVDNGDFFKLAYSDGTRFLVRSDANYVWGKAGPGLTDEDLSVYLAGPILGFVLRCKGRLALHASAACLGELAITLVGPAGAGKSTVAAVMALRNRPICCEDVCVLQERDGTMCIVPGYPRVCLWPEAVRMLFSREDALPLIVAGWEKRYLALDQKACRFAASPVPLGAIYVLAPRTEGPGKPKIQALSRQEAALHLIQNSYMNWTLDRRQRAEEFEAIARLVGKVKCFALTRSGDPSGLDETASLLEAHALSL
jgi:hypothetical protein